MVKPGKSRLNSNHKAMPNFFSDFTFIRLNKKGEKLFQPFSIASHFLGQRKTDDKNTPKERKYLKSRKLYTFDAVNIKY